MILIGNSPSSGSTFLANILDSTPYSACGSELNLFSNKNLFDFDNYKKDKFKFSTTYNVYRLFTRIYTHKFSYYGLTLSDYEKLINESKNLNEFIEKFENYYLSLRGKNNNAIMFEKTPENLNTIGEFLNLNENNYFIYIVRNPIYVYKSLLNRGFSTYMAFSAWLIDVAKILKFKNNPRVISIKYEELIQDPYLAIKSIFKIINREFIVTKEEFEHLYANNRYRLLSGNSIQSWSVKEYGIVQNANKGLNKDIITSFSNFANAKINPKYAKKFNLKNITFIDALNEFGYSNDIKFQEENVTFKREFKDTKRLLHKLYYDFKAGFSSIKDIDCYLNPII